MQRQRFRVGTTILIGVWLILGHATEPLAEDTVRVEKQRQAESLYAAGRYAEALPLLVELTSEGPATGALLYRLSYCQRIEGDEAQSRETEAQARALLEKELPETKILEVPFYLSNTYQNAGRQEDVRRVAAAATTRVETGAIAEPTSGDGMFQLGKLYADQGLELQAMEWYDKAVDALTGGGTRPGGPYARWASRYIGERSLRAQDFESAERHLTVLADAGGASAAELDALAVARTRLGKYDEAIQTWNEVKQLAPSQANRAQYCSALCRLAVRVGELPPNAPSGKPWIETDRAELEALMKEQAEAWKAVFADAEQLEVIDKPVRQELRAELLTIRDAFVPAALEFALRGYGIRQTAFFGGYAPMILRQNAYRPPPKRIPEGNDQP